MDVKKPLMGPLVYLLMAMLLGCALMLVLVAVVSSHWNSVQALLGPTVALLFVITRETQKRMN